jgi:fatty acid desaturase
MAKQQVKKQSSWKWRLVLTVVLLAIAWLAISAYEAAESPILSKIAVQQAQDSDIAYAKAHLFLGIATIPTIIKWATTLVLGLVWVTFLFQKLQAKRSK